jgi:selenocysteine lyase/cysteine desulfurase
MDLEKNIEKIRADFPIFNTDVTFLDAAGHGPLAYFWMDAIEEYWQKRKTSQEKPKSDFCLYTPGPKMTAEQRARYAQAGLIKAEATRFINAKDANEIAWINRPLQGFNIIKEFIPWEKGDNLVFTDQGYPSSGQTWLSLRKKGVELRQVQHVDGKVLLHGGPSIKKEIVSDCWAYGDLDQAIDERTKLVCINRTTWHLGFTYDVEAVCNLAHEKGALVADDAFQALGAVKVDVDQENLDFLVTGCHKWQCGPGSVGFLYIREDLIEKYEPEYSTYGKATFGRPERTRMQNCPGYFGQQDHDNVLSYNYPYVKDASKFERGTIHQSCMVGFGAAMKYLNNLGLTDIEKRVCKLGDYYINRLRDIGCKVNTPLDPKERHGLINYTTGSYENDKMSCIELAKKQIAGPMIRYQGGIGGIRTCVHFYSTEEDVEKLIALQKDLMPS